MRGITEKFAGVVLFSVVLVAVQMPAWGQSWTDCPDAYEWADCDVLWDEDAQQYNNVCSDAGDSPDVVECYGTQYDDLFILAEDDVDGKAWAYGMLDVLGSQMNSVVPDGPPT